VKASGRGEVLTLNLPGGTEINQEEPCPNGV
jgi:hypothetical protein